MKTEIPIAQLLRWRLARAEVEAPPAPRAARLLDLARPWWETWPERFHSLVERLRRMQLAYGHAMAEPRSTRCSHPVPALLVRAQTAEELETSARVLYLDVRQGRLRLRFQLEAASRPPQEQLELTFVCDQTGRPVLSGQATLSVDNEYRLETELPEDLARHWENLKVTDRMPFRFLLRSGADTG